MPYVRGEFMKTLTIITTLIGLALYAKAEPINPMAVIGLYLLFTGATRLSHIFRLEAGIKVYGQGDPKYDCVMTTSPSNTATHEGILMNVKEIGK